MYGDLAASARVESCELAMEAQHQSFGELSFAILNLAGASSIYMLPGI